MNPRHGSRQPPKHDLVTRIHNSALQTPTGLAGRFDVPSSNNPNPADSSSSESDAYTSRPRTSRPQHARSMSNPFPSLFSTRKRRQDSTSRPAPDLNVDGDDAGVMAGANTGKQPRPGASAASSKDFATGNCMTCASLVKWPKDLKVFKCTICSTINDLVPVQGDVRRNATAGRARGMSNDLPGTHQRGRKARLYPLPPFLTLCSRRTHIHTTLQATSTTMSPPVSLKEAVLEVSIQLGYRLGEAARIANPRPPIAAE